MKEHVVTLAWLCRRGASAEECKRFRERFGKSVVLTPEVVRNAVGVFDIEWFAYAYLSAAAWERYRQATAAALDRCVQAMAAARDQYGQANAAAWAQYEQEITPALIAALWPEGGAE